MISALLDLICPARCALCAEFTPIDWPNVCPGCAESVFSAAVEGGPGGLVRYAGGMFEGQLREAIIRLKFCGEAWRGPAIGRWLASDCSDSASALDLVVPVPLGRRRSIERGFNQAGLIAGAFARGLGVAFAPLALSRLRETPPQSGLDETERVRIAGAFAASMPLGGARVAVVDDVTTTGHTLAACASALRAAGAAEVVAVCAAFAPRIDASNDRPS